MLITLKVDIGSWDRVVAGNQIRRGEMLGFSPYFDDQLVLSPIDGIIERIKRDEEEQAVIISIRRLGMQRQAAYAEARRSGACATGSKN